jgi:hypothetical protein
MTLVHDLRRLVIGALHYQDERDRLLADAAYTRRTQPVEVGEDDVTEVVPKDSLEIRIVGLQAAIQEVIALGTQATFDQKLNAFETFRFLRRHRTLLEEYNEHHRNPLFDRINPDRLVGDSGHNIWEAMRDPFTGERFREAVATVLGLPEVAQLRRYDPNSDQGSYWRPDELRRLYEEVDIYD